MHLHCKVVVTELFKHAIATGFINLAHKIKHMLNVAGSKGIAKVQITSDLEIVVIRPVEAK
jgi:hypothetical protein